MLNPDLREFRAGHLWAFRSARTSPE
jgi:hypothetical protein